MFAGDCLGGPKPLNPLNACMLHMLTVGLSRNVSHKSRSSWVPLLPPLFKPKFNNGLGFRVPPENPVYTPLPALGTLLGYFRENRGGRTGGGDP